MVGETPPILSLLQGLSPMERQRFLQSTLAGAGYGVNQLLQQNPGAGVGQLLLAAGTGFSGGYEQGLQGIQLAQQQEAEGEFARLKISEAQRKEQQAQQLQALLEDPNTPPQQREMLRGLQAGVPVELLKPAKPERTQIFGGERGGYFTLTPEGQAQQLRAGLGSDRSAEPLVEVYDPESGRSTYQPRSQAVGMQVPPGSGGGVDPTTEARRRQELIDLGYDQNVATRVSYGMTKIMQSADGRSVEVDEATGETRDVTPAMAGDRPMIPSDPGRMTIAEAPSYGTGIASGFVNFLNRTYGQFDPEAVSRDVAIARPAMSQFKTEVRELNTIGGRPTNLQLETIDQIVPGTELLQSPEGARAAMGQVRGYMIETYNRYQQALKSPALKGNERVEMEMKVARLGQLIGELEPLALREPRGQAQATAERRVPSSSRAPSPQASGDFSSMSPQDFGQVDIKSLSEKELDDFIEEGRRRGL